MLMRLPHRQCSDAHEADSDRAYPEETPLPDINESGAKQNSLQEPEKRRSAPNHKRQTLKYE
jgi:hypothetical protein